MQVRLRRGFVVRAIEPRAVVSLAADAAPAPPNLRPWTVLDRFAAIDIVRGALRIQGDGGSRALQIDGIEAHATRAGGKLAATVVANAVAFTRPEYGWREATDARIDIDLPDTTHTVHVRSARVVVGQSVVEATGELQQINPLIGNAQVAVPAAMSLLRTFVPDALPGGLEGEIAARIDFEADRSGQRATLVADASAVRLAGVGPWDGRIAAHLDGDLLRLDDFDLQAYGGSIRGEGVVALDGAASSLRARLRGVDLARVLSAHTDLAVRVASRADADLVLRHVAVGSTDADDGGHRHLRASDQGRGFPFAVPPGSAWPTSACACRAMPFACATPTFACMGPSASMAGWTSAMAWVSRT